MYISGKLKDKTINFYKPTITNFDSEGIDAIEANISYNGELILPPWNESIESKLKRKQEELINRGIEKTKELANKKYFSLKYEIDKTITIICATPRKYSFALFECYYQVILSSTSITNLVLRTREFKKFLESITNENINQIDLEIKIALFLNRQAYNQEETNRAKDAKFNIDHEEILSSSLEEIVTFGEFASPNRVRKIASNLTDIEASKLVLPIYFAIPDEVRANKFLALCRTPDLDEGHIKRSLKKLELPSNYQNLIR